MIADYFFRSKQSIFLKIPHMLYLVVKTGKLSEFVSFCWWEFLDKIGSFRGKYISMDPNKCYVDISSNKEDLLFVENPFFSKSQRQYQTYFKDKEGSLYYSLVVDPNILWIEREHQTPIQIFVAPAPIVCVFVSQTLSIFVCIEQHIYRASYSSDIQYKFTDVLKFITQTGYLRTNFSYTENNKGELFMAEYAAVYHSGLESRHRTYTKAYQYIENVERKKGWECVAYLYHSQDDGKTWNSYDFLKRNGTNKHIHIIQWSNFLHGLILTDGDNTKHLYFNQSSNYKELTKDSQKGWKDLTIHHIKKGGYTSMVECEDSIIFGTDYMGGTNFFRKTKDLSTYREQIIPNPYRRCIVDSMTLVTCQKKPLIFANLLCSYSNKYNSRILLSTDRGETWTTILEYDGFSHFVDIINNNYSETKELYFLISNNKDTNVTYSFSLLGLC